jgi:hypothetical protein
MSRRSRHAEPRRPSRRSPNPPDQPPRSPDFAHHSLKCRVCRHPRCRDIEEAFLRWRSPEKLARDYDIPDHSYIYRHVHATGLFARRRHSLTAALERILERSDEERSSDLDVIRAAGAYAHLDDQGRWQEPNPQQIVILVGDPADLANLPDLSILSDTQLEELRQQAARTQSPTRESRK